MRNRHFLLCLDSQERVCVWVCACADKLRCNVSMFIWLWLSTSNTFFRKHFSLSHAHTRARTHTRAHTGYKKNCLCTVSSKQMGFCSPDFNTVTVSGSVTVTDCSAILILRINPAVSISSAVCERTFAASSPWYYDLRICAVRRRSCKW